MATDETATKGSSFVNHVKSRGFLFLDQPQRRFFITQLSLRLLAAVLTLSAILITVTSSQSIFIFGFQLQARYSYSSAYKFLVGVDAVACAFSTLSIIYVCILNRPGSHLNHHFFLFLHDMVMTVVITSGCAAATAIGYVGQYGEQKMGWQPVCNHVTKFCNQVLVALLLSYLSSLLYLALTILSAHRLIPRPPSEFNPSSRT